ncbi:hypothetical protein AZE42_01997 [Rhizopogon vesiculosus]|uniref:Uncharacterized protein n=1 Tax=Rhizopogon vesiculosus TaxID=180088 RepID=A0A1J8PL81_9AGAM|nr:hypothetical protein AZE42_01997 [Rhizopogon vesiculosus]
MSTPEPENATFKTVFLINLVVYNPVKLSAKKKKSEEKVDKLKGSGNAETDEYTLYYELAEHQIWLPVPHG